MPVVPKRLPMPAQDPMERRKNFNEVALGFNEELAVAEAKRCLKCKENKCREGCPVEVDIQEMITRVAEGDFAGAIASIKSTNSLPAICGRVCPQEEQCEKVCLMGKKHEPVAVGRIERFCADWELAHGVKLPECAPPNGIKMAIVGSGPAGLTCAGDLARLGYDVTIFEALHAPGGVLIYGIPEFRLPKRVVMAEVENIKKMGAKLLLDVVVGRTISLEELFADGFEAMFLGTGAGLPKFMDIPGENLCGVYSANEFLTRTNLMKAYLFPGWDTPIKCGQRVAVVGGGNVAMDSVRCSLRLGAAEGHIVYRRSEAEMPARLEELHHAKEEGVIFDLLTNPVRVIGDDNGWVKGLECIRMELGEPDESGRRRPVEIPGSNLVIDVDTVVMALGTSPNPLLSRTTPGLNMTKWGGIIIDEETGMSSRPGIFAGGDAVTGAATVILAMGAGKKAAAGMHKYVQSKRGR